MRFSLEQLEAFLAAAEAGSFSAAARKLGKAQSRVSTAIGNLEVDLGVLLFDRSAKLPVLTKAGEELLFNASKVLDHSHGLIERADRLAGGEQTTVRIAIDELLPSAVMADVLKEFSETFPRTKVDVLWGALGDVGDMVSSAIADVGIDMPVNNKPPSECEWQVLANTNFCCAVASDHPLAKSANPSRGDLEQYCQILPISREGKNLLTEFRFSEQVWQCEDSRIARELVRRGVGWSAFPRYQIAGDLKKGTLTELSIALGESEIVHSFYYIWDKNRLLTEAEEWLAAKFTERLTPLCNEVA